MDYLFLAFLVLGLLLIAGAYLFIVFRSFQNHFVTGLLALIPVVNLLIVFIMWRDMRYGFYLSILGLMLAGSAWYLGAEKQLLSSSSSLFSSFSQSGESSDAAENTAQNTEQASKSTGETETQSQSLSLPIPISRPQDIEVPNAEAVKEAGVEAKQDDEDYIIRPAPPLSRNQLLPTVAEKEVFESIPVADLSAYIGKVVRVETDNGREIEGKVLSVQDGTLSLETRIAEGSVAYSIKLDKLSRVEAVKLKAAE